MTQPGVALDIMAIFDGALHQPSPSARREYLDRACGGDEQVRTRVESLLAAHDRAGAFLESPAPPPTVDLETRGVGEGAGAVIGPYKLLEQIGEGGMGVVYAAEQKEPVRRKVALKIIKPGMDTKQVVARFEAERQALALMDHPNIARVIDGGTTPEGRPFFVMELVRGIPITEYCDREQLSIRDRLDLFVLVCRAVQHAHQQGIIHRDLKPSNILVTVIDGAAVPKVIDFGVAKAVSGSLTEGTVYTGLYQFVGTPLYMSPEQAELSGVDVDTRGDIYALGVLLYELLTGTTPFEEENFRKAAVEELRRIIREHEPPRPSARLSTLAEETRSSVSTRRNSDPKRLLRSVRGELDWIVMKALEKDRRRRYDSANDFAADVMRHLTNQQVHACPPGAWYRFSKLARRHRVGLSAAALVGVTVVAAVVVSGWQAVRTIRAERESGRQARLARTTAEAVRNHEIHLRRQAEDFAEQSRRRQVQLCLESGSKLMNDGDLARSLSWFVEALRLDHADPAREEVHRIRIAAILAQCPKPSRIWFHDQPASWAELRPDGRAAAVALRDGTVTVHDLSTGKAVGPGLRHAAFVSVARFSPDGRRLLTASDDHMARVWDVASGREVFSMKHDGEVRFAAFHPDGTRIVTHCLVAGEVTPASCRLWDAGTGRPITPSFRAGHPAFSPDGRFLATGEAEPVRLYDARTGGPVNPQLSENVSTEGWAVHPECFSPDGRRFVTVSSSRGERRVRIWDTQKGELAVRPVDLPELPAFASFSPDGRTIAVALTDGVVQLLDATTGIGHGAFMSPAGGVTEVWFSRDGTRILSACKDAAVRVWDVATGRLLFSALSGFASRSGPSDGRHVLTVGTPGLVRVWDLATASPIRQWLPGAGAADRASFSPDGQMLATTENGGVRFWDVATGRPSGDAVAVTAGSLGVCQFSPDGRSVLTTSADEVFSHIDAWVCDVASRKVVAGPLRRQFNAKPFFDSLAIARWSPDGRRIATAAHPNQLTGTTGYQVRVWNGRTGDPVSPLLSFDVPVRSIEFSPDGLLLAVGCGYFWDPARHGEARILVASTGQPRIPPIQTPSICNLARFSPNGQHLVTASGDELFGDCSVRVWDVRTGQAVTPPLPHQGPTSAEFSPDGLLVASAGAEGTVQLWDAAKGVRMTAPLRHLYPVHSAAFSPDGRFILTNSSPTGNLAETRAYAQVWDAASGQPVTPPLWHRRAIRSAAFARDSRRFITTAGGDEAWLWRLKPDPRPIEDLRRLATVLSGTRTDDSGLQEPADPSELRAAYEDLQRRDPDTFSASRDQVLGSHLERSIACAAAGAWEAALEHLNVLIADGRDVRPLRHQRARVHAELDHWSDAAEDYRRMELSTDDSFYDWYSLALLEMGRENRPGYRDACATLLRTFGTADSPGLPAEFAAWSCALRPGCLDDYGPAIRLSERLSTAQPKDRMIATTLGALLCRAGRFEEAATKLAEALERERDPQTSPIHAWFFLAMAHHGLGHDAEAKTWREKAVSATEQVLSNRSRENPDQTPWDRRLTLRLLRAEVEALLRPDDPIAMPNGPDAFAR